MADYIKRNDLFVLSRDYYSQGLKEEAVPVRAIKNIPSADVAEVRHGEWKLYGEPPWYVRECSECGEKWHHWQGYSMPNFCPNCGADMRGGT